MTANAVCSLSLDPLLLLVCFANGARTLRVVRETGRFGVNVLAAGQEDLARLFASKTPEREKFAGVQHTVHDGIPVIEGTLAWVGCTLQGVDPRRRPHDRDRHRHRRRGGARRRAPGLVPRRVPVSDLHTLFGGIAVGVNALAAVIGGVAWLARAQPEAVLDRAARRPGADRCSRP